MKGYKIYDTKVFKFEAAHNLIGYDGDCSNLHGHSYKLEVTISGYIDFDQQPFDTAYKGMILDFKKISEIVKENVIKTHDHAYLNDLYHCPTAEVMVVSIFNFLKKKFISLPCRVALESVKLWETDTSFAEFKGEYCNVEYRGERKE